MIGNLESNIHEADTIAWQAPQHPYYDTHACNTAHTFPRIRKFVAQHVNVLSTTVCLIGNTLDPHVAHLNATAPRYHKNNKQVAVLPTSIVA
jgi:hypothetical protein